MLQRLQQLEQTATEQLSVRRLIEVQGRITQLDKAFQQGARSTGQVVDTRVLWRPDKLDDSEKAWPNSSFVVKAYEEAIDLQLSADLTRADISTTVLDNDTMSPRTQARSVQLNCILIMLCTGRALDRIDTARAPRRTMRGWS